MLINIDGYTSSDKKVLLMTFQLSIGILLLGIYCTVGRANQLSDYSDKLKRNFVQIESIFKSCSTRINGLEPSKGLGFVIGENDSSIFVMTPWHVIRREIDNGTPSKPKLSICHPDKVSVRFHHVPYSKPKDFKFQAIQVLDYKRKPNNDIDFLKLPKPEGWRNAFHLMRSSYDTKFNVNYIGYKGHAVLAIGKGVVIDSCETEISPACSLWVEGLETRRGESGAMLFDEFGYLVGMNTDRLPKEDIRALRIDEIRAEAEKLKIPWNVFTPSEVEHFGVSLNKAIQSFDKQAALRLINKYFPLDQKYRYLVTGEYEYESSDYPINIAARDGQLDLVHQMISKGASHVWVAAIIGLEKGDDSITSEIAAKGLGLRCTLFYAISNERLQSIKMLLKEEYVGKLYNIDELCQGDTTPLYEAIRKGYEDIALKVLALGADPNRGEIDRVFYKGFPLSLAILKRQKRVVEGLLEHNANVNSLSYPPGITITKFKGLGWIDLFGPLHAAAAVGDIELIDYLVGKGGDPDAHRINYQGSLVVGESPFEVALLSGETNAAEHLAGVYGASPLGYRYEDQLIEDIRRVFTSGADIYRAERVISKFEGAWCRKIKKSDFENTQDYWNQYRKCNAVFKD